MFKHIVMWSINDPSRIDEARGVLEGMRGKIPCLLALEVGVDVLHSEQSADLVLIATLQNRHALASYQGHPAHQPAIALMGELASRRTVVDYEV